MHTEPREDPLVELGYDHRDVDIPKIRTAVIWFFGFAIGSFLVGLLVYKNRTALFLRENRAAYSNANRTRRLPEYPNPLLQDNVIAKTDLMIMRQGEQKIIEGQGPLNDGSGRWRIPVEHAINLTAERGLAPTGRSVPAVSRGNTSGANPATDAVPGGAAPGGNAGSATPPQTAPATANPQTNGR